MQHKLNFYMCNSSWKSLAHACWECRTTSYKMQKSYLQCIKIHQRTTFFEFPNSSKTKKPGKFKIIEARLAGNFCPFFYDMPISSTGRSRYKQERSHNHFDEPFFCQVVRVSRFPPFFILRALYADNWRLQGNDPLCKLKKRKPFLKMQKKDLPNLTAKERILFWNPPSTAFSPFCKCPQKLQLAE